MRWPFARSETEQPPQDKEISIEPAIELHRSPGLESALVKLREDRSCHILDLGPAEAQSVAFLSRFPCRLSIMDIVGFLAEEPHRAAKPNGESENVFDGLLPGGQQLFDVVLAWTVFDHIGRDTARQLVTQVARRTRPGGLLFALVATGDGPPAGRLSFAIHDRSTLRYRPAQHPAQCSASLNPAAFAQLLTGYAIEHSFVLRHGFQEYVAARLGDDR